MKSPSSKTRSQVAMLPLLCSIQLEIVERSQRIAVLEERLETFAATPRIHAEEIACLRSELSTQRRELRYVAKELAQLGIEFDAQAPRPIVGPRVSRRIRRAMLDETGFRFWTAESRS